MNQDTYKALSDEYRSQLNLEGFPAAVKMIEKVEMLDDIYYKGKPVNTLKKKLLVCQLISQARFYGRVIAGVDKNLDMCRLGGDAMGFE